MRKILLSMLFAITVLASFAQETPPTGTVQATTSTSYIAPGGQIWGRYSGAGVAAFYTKLVRDKDLKDSLAALNNKFILNNPPTPQPGNIKLKYGQITIARPDDESLNAVQLYSGGGLTLGSANGSATLVAGQTISLSTPSSTTNINPDQVTSGGTDGSFRLAKDMVTGSTTSTGSGYILQPTNVILRKSGSVSRGLAIPSNATGNHVLYPPNKTDTVATVSDFIPYQLKNEKGAANGYAPLDGAGKVPLANINDALLGAVNYRGTYDASANTPALPAASTSNKGYYYIVSTAGTQFGLTFRIGDWIISNGSAYGKVSSSSDVESVNGKKGVVVLNSADISGVVDLTSSQTISGVKSFDNGINISSGSIMRAALGDSYSSVDASGLTAGETSTSIFSTLQKDEVIYNKGANKLHVKAPTTITGEITQSFQNKNGTVAYMDDVATKANDADVVKVLGNQNIDNAKTFIGNIYVPTRSNATNNQEAASTAYVWNKIASKADLSGATFGGSIVANGGISTSSIGITGNLDVNGTSNFNGQTNVPNAPNTADNSKTAANTKFVQDRLGSGQTIGANTTGNAATANLATSATQWNNQIFVGASPGIAAIMTNQSGTNNWGYSTLTQVKTSLATTLQDVTAAGNTTTDQVGIGVSPAAAMLQVRTTDNIKPAGYLYNPNTTAGTSRGLVVEGGTNASDYSAIFNQANGDRILTLRGDGNVGIGTISPSEKLEVNGNIKADNLAGTTYTPVITGPAISSQAARYTRVGNVVTVSGTIAHTYTAGSFTLEIPLPISTNITSQLDVSGSVINNNNKIASVGIIANTTTGKATALLTASSGSSGIDYLTYNFTYTIK